MGLEVKKSESVPLSGNNVEGLGFDNIMVGTAEGTKAGAVSKTVAGFNGVFILKVNSVSEAPATGDFAAQKKQLQQSINGRSDYAIMNALKEMADIEDHKSRID